MSRAPTQSGEGFAGFLQLQILLDAAQKTVEAGSQGWDKEESPFGGCFRKSAETLENPAR